MTKEDGARFASIMAGMAETFGVAISEAGMMMRFAALAEYDIRQIETACIESMKGHRFSTMPTVAELIDFIGGGRVEDRALVEASKVWQAVIDHGSYRDIVFDDAVTMAVISRGFGGWVKLCSELQADQRKWFDIEFSKLYGAYSRTGQRHGGVLPGLAAGKSPVLVGDKAKAVEVLAIGQQEKVALLSVVA